MKTDHPVEQVSYTEVNKFIEGLNKISATGDTKSQELLEQIILGHKKGDVYDLPTEAQWEFVMRDRGNANKKYFDQDDESRLKNFAWFNENSGDQTHAVASLQPRMVDGLPFYDLEGNVWEWSKDWYMDKLKGGKDPETSAGYVLGVRGGSWSYGAACARPGYRGYYHADSRLAHVGFRLIRTRP
jgi:formylglycine-generating enzyme required for sulfatase activity